MEIGRELEVVEVEPKQIPFEGDEVHETVPDEAPAKETEKETEKVPVER